MPAAEAQTLANKPWWELFDDPQLQELIRIALVENKDLKIAVERIEEARARYGFTKADLWPKVDLNATSGGLRFNGGSLVHTPDADTGGAVTPTETAVYSLTADMSWEIDFFGRIRRATEAQKALFFGTLEARRSAVLTLVADLARAYFELRAFDLQLEIAQRTMASRREYLELAQDRFEGGLTPEVDLRQAEAELLRIEVVTYDLALKIRQAENLISILIGRNPGPVLRGRGVTEQKRPASVPPACPPSFSTAVPTCARRSRTSPPPPPTWPGQGPALPPHRPHRLLRLHEHRVRHVVRRAEQGLEHPRERPAADLQRGQEPAPRRDHGVAAAPEPLRIRAHDPPGLPRDGGRPRRLSEDGRAARGPGPPRGAERKVLDLAELRYRGGVAAYLEVLDAQRSLFGAEIDETQTITAQPRSLPRPSSTRRWAAAGLRRWTRRPTRQAPDGGARPVHASPARVGLARPGVRHRADRLRGARHRRPHRALVLDPEAFPVRTALGYHHRRGHLAGDAPGAGEALEPGAGWPW